MSNRNTIKIAKFAILNSAKKLILNDPDMDNDTAEERLRILGVWSFIENQIAVRAEDMEYNLFLESILHKRTSDGEYSA